MSNRTLLASRYRLGPHLGGGGGGEVYLATDTQTGAQVALKFLKAVSPDALARARRELGALERLRHPGIVRMLDQGIHNDLPFVVMEYVEGAPWPGLDSPTEWSQIEPRLKGLLEVLQVVHGAGMVHRDLKPANVQVRTDGSVVLLDFGLVRSLESGSTITQSGTALGTPRYLAPEQIWGDRADERADLYAVGAMLYEALSGHAPHEADSVELLLQRRLHAPPKDIRFHLPQLSAERAGLVHSLLSRDARQRPATVSEVLATLAGQEDLPFLGSTDHLEMLAESIRRRQRTVLIGAPGSGRSRTLRTLERRVPGALRLGPGRAPFSSLAALDSPPEGSPAQIRSHYLGLLEQRFADGGWLLVDDPEGLDRWTRKLLDAVQGPVVRIGASGEGHTVRQPGLQPRDLEALFCGPELLLHLPSDAARILHRLSGGNPRRMSAQLKAWERQGVVSREGERFRVSRQALDSLDWAQEHPATLDGAPDLEVETQTLLAWIQLGWPYLGPEQLADALGRPLWEVQLELEELEEAGLLDAASRSVTVLIGAWRLADSVLEDAERWLAENLSQTRGRLRHALRLHGPVGRLDSDLCEEVCRLRLAGQPEQAAALLLQGLARLKRPSAPLAREVFRVATRESVDAAALAPFLPAALREWVRLPESQLGEEWVRALAAGPIPLGLELDCLAQLWRASRSEELLEVLLERAGEFADQDPSRVDSWAATLEMIRWQGRGPGLERERALRQASASLVRTAGRRISLDSQVSNYLSAANALVALGQLGEAEELAVQGLALAREARLINYEAQARWLRRWIDRCRRGPPPDRELAEAALALGGAVGSKLVLGELLMALRAEERELASELCEVLLGGGLDDRLDFLMPYLAIVGACLSGGADTVTQEQVSTLPRVFHLDAYALLHRHNIPNLEPTIRAAYDKTPAAQRDLIQGIWSPDEVLAWFEGSP